MPGDLFRGRNRPTSTIKRCQEPFHVGAIQFDVFEGIHALRDIRYDILPFHKIRLPFCINLRFSSPELSLCFPIRLPCFFIAYCGMMQRSYLCIVLLAHEGFLFCSNISKLTYGRYYTLHWYANTQPEPVYPRDKIKALGQKQSPAKSGVSFGNRE